MARVTGKRIEAREEMRVGEMQMCNSKTGEIGFMTALGMGKEVSGFSITNLFVDIRSCQYEVQSSVMRLQMNLIS